MIVVWGKPVMAEIDQIVDAVRAELLPLGLLRHKKDTGSDIMLTCTEHKNGRESKPSMGIAKVDKTDINDHTIPAGTVHCFTCGYKADLPSWIARVFGLKDPAAGMMWLMRRFAYAVDGERAEIRLNLNRTKRRQQVATIPESEVLEYWAMLDDHEDGLRYLTEKRGIPRDLIDKFKLGYNPHESAVGIPVRLPDGRCLFIKWRNIHTKVYLNAEDVPKTLTLFGLDEVIKEIARLKAAGVDPRTLQVWLPEGEFDCIALWKRGKLAAATMGSELTEYQAKLLMRLGVGSFVAATDNDNAGRKGARIIKDLLIPMGGKVYNVRYGETTNDWNAMSDAEFANIVLY